jgi:hypothetical protein
MALPAFLLPLVSQGLSLLGNAALAKGKEWVEQKTGVSLDQPLSQEDVVKLRQFELEHEEELQRLRLEDKRLDLEELKVHAANTQGARQMNQESMKSDDPIVRRFIYFYALFWSVCSAVYIGFITFGEIPKDNVRFADTILGFLLGTIVATIINFFYGSSKGSQDKTAALTKELEDGK